VLYCVKKDKSVKVNQENVKNWANIPTQFAKR